MLITAVLRVFSLFKFHCLFHSVFVSCVDNMCIWDIYENITYLLTFTGSQYIAEYYI